VNACFGESDEAREESAASPLCAEDLEVDERNGVLELETTLADFVATVCVLPLNIESSSLLSSGSEGLKMSFCILGAMPLVVSR
jgi:hypothetical protein